MEMKSMKLSPKAKSDMMSPATIDRPEYPWGLRISLNNDSIDKLGLSDLPAAGDTLTIHAKVKVSSVSMDESDGGKKNKRCELQITDMAVGDPPKLDRAKVMYGS